MAKEAVEDLRGFRIGGRIHRMHLHRRLHLTRIVDDLADESWQPTDREAWPALKLALPDNLVRPLLA